MSQPDTAPLPALFSRTITAYESSGILNAAIELDLFSAFEGAALDVAHLAAHCESSERGIRILCDCLVALGFLTKEDEFYAATVDSAKFLDSSSPAYIGEAAAFLRSARRREGFDRFAECVRAGGTVVSEEGVLAVEDPMWVTFARAMAPMSLLHADVLARRLEIDESRPVRVLDLAAGHGMYGITLARDHANVEVVAIDWPNVLEVTREHAASHGVADRHRTVAGSALEVDLGSGYDVALLTGFLHLFDRESCERLLSRVHEALLPEGRAVIVDFMPDEGKISPPVGATFAAVMLATTPAGDAYTADEYAAMAAEAGFADCSALHLEPSPLRATVAHKHRG